MRLFVACSLPSEIKDYLLEIEQSIGNDYAKVKWIDKPQMHLTLKFLGETSDVANIKTCLSEVKYQHFSVNLSNLGVFPNKNYIRVIWVGLKPEDKVIKLQKLVDKCLSDFKNDYDFHPHITLGRVKYVTNKDDLIKKLDILIKDFSIQIDNFKLYQSELTRQGSIYKELGTYALI
jgi:2'-5' RNA ligase